jgi:hypothetical protein
LRRYSRKRRLSSTVAAGDGGTGTPGGAALGDIEEDPEEIVFEDDEAKEQPQLYDGVLLEVDADGDIVIPPVVEAAPEPDAVEEEEPTQDAACNDPDDSGDDSSSSVDNSSEEEDENEDEEEEDEDIDTEGLKMIRAW